MHRGNIHTPRWFVLVLAVGLVMAVMAPVAAVDEFTDGVSKSDHKIMNKIDQIETFVTARDYDNTAVPAKRTSGTTWTYEAHIKEAMNPIYSRGVVKFTDGVNEIVGHVEVTARDYAYWNGKLCFTNVFAAAGTATYNDAPYDFIFLHADQATWIVLSTHDYQEVWGDGGMWSSRAVEVLSPWPPPCDGSDPFAFDEKIIHE